MTKPSFNNHGHPDDHITGVIFDIQPFSVHDGPGIRTLIFIKGCPLDCKWCSNPESQFSGAQVLFKKDLCRKCGACHGRTEKEMEDAELCPYGALQVCGQEITIGELMEIIQRDRPFFGDTGGITLSGGEPFFQPAFILPLLERCAGLGISTAIETSLYIPFNYIERALPFLKFFMFDLKLMDPERHLKYCGVDNEMILENIAQLAKTAHIPLLPRMPLIPGVNDDDENIRKTAEFLRGNELMYINILPYMRLGVSKYEQIGRKYELDGTEPPSEDDMNRVKAIFYESDIFCL
jgi:pyruvate formate lyase activating enzyme